MDWSKATTIFIVVFLILNVFLFTEFIKKWETSQYAQREEQTLEQQIKKENISLTQIPSEKDEYPYLNARVHEFSADEESSLMDQSASTIVRNNKQEKKLLVFLNDDSIAVEDPENPEELKSYLEEFVIGGEEYKFLEYQEDPKRLIYHQVYKDMDLYHNINGRLVFYLNEKAAVDSYEQTMLTSIEEFAEVQELIPPSQALEALYRKSLVEPDSKVDVELGYYTFIHLAESNPETQVLSPTGRLEENVDGSVFKIDGENTSETQVLTPTWRLDIEQKNGEQVIHYVNAVDGSVFEINEENEAAVE
ncbi:two-component system regulatory protein YycI [Jeotgalibacillus marinus]|uniref:Two-component system regulatory protein YycI n=1 Tax=Jeotgalibacillus marinus TaxID=86667 RepID=A0ABV3Q1E6_9BACL